MARDNSPRKRQLHKLERKQNQRASYDRILIVTEGRKTEPTYFSEISSFYHLRTANVCILPSRFGTCPLRIVEYAKHLFELGDQDNNIRPRSFKKNCAVFDRDDHIHYL